MNYKVGRKIVISALVINLVAMLISSIATDTVKDYTSLNTIYTVVEYVGILVSAFVALGFAAMYADGLNKHDLYIAGASAVGFLSLFIFCFIPLSQDTLQLGHIIKFTLYAAFPIAWAIKYKNKIPAVSIALVVSAVWIATNTCIYSSLFDNVFRNTISWDTYTALYKVVEIITYVAYAVMIVAAFLDKQPKAEEPIDEALATEE